MKPILNQPSPPGGAVVLCDVVAHATVRATTAAMQQLRQNVFLPSGERLPPAFLKHAEDQTVAGLVAVCDAIRTFQLGQSAFHDWAVLGAPRFLGRLAMHGAIQKFLVEGAWGISPHLIPHRLLHAVSGTVSLALKIQGPNFGVGGGPGGIAEAFLAAAALLRDGRLPGVWVILTGCDPEPRADSAAGTDATCVCNALALALVAARKDGCGLRLRVNGKPNVMPQGLHDQTEECVNLETLQDLVANLSTHSPLQTRHHHLSAGLTLEWVSGSYPLPPPKSPSFNGNGRHGSRGHIEAAAEKES